MNFLIRLFVSSLALAALSAQAADITGTWTATVVTAAGQRDYTYVFRQDGGRLIGTLKSQDGVVAISNGYINHETITFSENVAVEGRRAVLEYTGELISETEIKFKRQVAGTSGPAVEFVARRTATR